jgi:carbonic anhydrase/acetyltransferase-like protein (isoleucine patch superfamily)
MTIRSFEQSTPAPGKNAFIDETALVIGKVTIGDDASIWPMAVVRGDIHSIDIGARTNIQDGSVLHVTHPGEFNESGYPLIIGEDVTVGHNVVLHGCTIGNRCLIGMGAIVMDGVVVPDDTIIGAGSLVTPGKQLEGGYLWLGSPARRIREMSDNEKKYMLYSSQHYVDLKNRHK